MRFKIIELKGIGRQNAKSLRKSGILLCRRTTIPRCKKGERPN